VADFKPPLGVVNNAKKAIEWREKYPKETSSAGTQIGWTRARQLANGESVSEDIIQRMVSFFARHEKNKEVAPEFRNEPWRDNGYLMWCLTGDTLIHLANGEQKTIKEIVDNKLSVDILTYNEKTKLIEPKQIIDWSCQDACLDDFISIGKHRTQRLHNSLKTFVKITGNHEIYCNNKWVNAKDVQINDCVKYLYLKHINNSEQIIIGTLLGDGHITKTNQLSFTHTIKHQEYALYKASFLSKTTRTVSKEKQCVLTKDSVSKPTITYRTECTREFEDLRNKLYIDGKKTIPLDFLNKLEDLGLAIWFMDDGSLHYEHSKTKTPLYRLHTEGFCEFSMQNIIEFFNKRGYFPKQYKRENCNGSVLYFNKHDSDKIGKIIAEYAPQCMQYKTIYNANNHNGGFVEKSYFVADDLVSTKRMCNTYKKPTLKKTNWGKKYNITVKDNHNYFANGMLVHNCAWGGDEGKTWCNKIYNQIQNNKSFSSSMGQMQYIHTKLESKSLDEIKGIITLKACYYGNVDRVKDILEKGSCNKSIQAFQNAKANSSWEGNKIRLLLEHNNAEILAINIDDLYDSAEAPIVVATISEDFKKLQPAKVQDIYQKIKDGKMFASIGYFPIKSYVDNNGIRHLQEVKLAEISLTTNPANMKATMIDLKSINLPKYPIDIESSWDGTQAEQRWREYTKSVEMPSTNYKNGFLHFDSENQDLFGSYHLQVVDVVEGEPKIIERAVFAVYQAMRGARGGLTVVPENEMPRLQGAVTELYKKINRVRVAEGMEALEMPNFKTKSEFDTMLDSLKDSNGLIVKGALSILLTKIRKGEIVLTQKTIKKLTHYLGQNVKKTLDNQNNDVKTETVAHETVPHIKSEHTSVQQTKTNSIPTLEEEFNNFFKI